MVATSKNHFEENLSNDFQLVLISKSSENDGQKIKKKKIEKKNIKLKIKALSLTHSLSLSLYLVMWNIGIWCYLLHKFLTKNIQVI